MVDVQKKRDGLVDRIGRLLPAEGVGVPHGKRLTAAIQRSRLISQSEEVIAEAALLADGKARSIPEHGGRVLLQNVALEVSHREQ
jgi:hypothetical protein